MNLNDKVEIKEEGSIESEEISDFKPENTDKKKSNFFLELVLFLILGILLGISIKTEARNWITIGFDDYKMKIKKQDFNINKIKDNQIIKQVEEAKNMETEEVNNNQRVE